MPRSCSRGSDGSAVSGSIAEVGYRRLGGLDHWVLMRGKSVANPIDDDHRCREERALRGELEGFLTSGRGSARDHDRARQALLVLGERG